MQHHEIREQFALFRASKNQVYLDSGASSQKPDSVIDAMSDFSKYHYANVHRGIHKLSQESTRAFEKSRQHIADFLGAKSAEEIIFVKGLTEGINLIAATFGKMVVKKGQSIIISEMEHHSNMVPWMMLAQEVGAKIKTIPVTKQGELDMHTYRHLLTEDVALVSVMHISNVLGTINPIEEISKLAKEKNIPVVIDGAQAAHHLPVDVQNIDCDFYVITGHKMYGPTGIGAIWGKRQHLEKMPPYHGGGEMVEEVHLQDFTVKAPPAKFEAGTPNIIGAVGLDYAISFIEKIGWERLQEIEQNVSCYCLEQLQAIQEVRILGQTDHKIGIFAFEIDGLHPADVATILDQEGVAVRVGYHCAQPLHEQLGSMGSVRVSLGVYNNHMDIDRLIEGIKKAQELLR